MKFLADMGISPQTVNLLRQQGHDAVHLLEEGLERLSDADILIKARNENRILLTVDLDFGYLLAVSGANLPSVILFRLDNATRAALEDRLSDVLNQCEEMLMQGAMISVSNEAFRVRPLPLT